MKIRTQARLGIGIAVALLVAASAALIAGDLRVGNALARADFATRVLSEDVSGLRLVMMEYLLHGEPQARERWQARHAALGRQLAGHPFRDAADLSIIEDLIRRHDHAGTVFARLVATGERLRGAVSPGPGVASEAERLAAEGTLAMHQMSSDAIRLVTRGHAQADEARRTASAVILLVIATTAVAIVVTALVTLRGVIAPLDRLLAGAVEIGRGNLATRIGIRRNDEIGNLARAFDHMAEQLSRSRDDLVSRSAQLEEANRELEAFSYSVSHDLRAPLRGIDGWSLALLEDFGESLDGKAREYIATVRQETQRMGRLIDDLLNLSRVGRAELRRERVDLSALAGSIADRLRAGAPSRILEFSIEPGIVATGDGHLLEIALTNLLDNAVKFTSRREVARIEFGVAREASAAGGHGTAYFVRDNGVGFDMAQARKLFGAFQRLHRASEFPGTGIGLVTVRRIINRHGGRIDGTSRVGEGATFTFSLGGEGENG